MFVGGCWRRIALGFFFLGVAGPAAAQGIARSFDQLQLLVRPGDKVTVTDASGREATGRIVDLSPSMLVLSAGGPPLQLSEPDVREIQQRRSDSLANGAIWGLAVGSAIATGLVVAFREDSDDLAPAVGVIAVYGGIGAGIGVGVDALISRRHVIYQRRSASAVEFGLTPLLSPQRKGALVSVRF
jgi:hypothetical protein